MKMVVLYILNQKVIITKQMVIDRGIDDKQNGDNALSQLYKSLDIKSTQSIR